MTAVADTVTLEAELAQLRSRLELNEREANDLRDRRTEVCRRLVDDHGVRLADVARMAGVSPSAVAFALGRYERAGRKRPNS